MQSPPLQLIYDALFEKWGPQQWWPAQTDLEMILGAILTQNTAWENVEKAIANLKAEHLLNISALSAIPEKQLADLLRPAGYFNQKARHIKALIQTLQHDFQGSLETLYPLETAELRTALLAMKGIGPETADCILLYAVRRPVFVVDAYTRRFLLRHGWIPEKCDYDAVAQLFTDQLPPDDTLFNEYHALIVQLGKEHCKAKPNCAGCPLESLRPN